MSLIDLFGMLGLIAGGVTGVVQGSRYGVVWAAVGAVVGAFVGVWVGVLAALLAIVVADLGCRLSRGTDSTGGPPPADGADASVPSPTTKQDDTAAES